MSRDLADLLFRALFSLIFIGLGFEHLFRDALIQRIMPDWMPLPRLTSIVSGIILLSGGLLIATGYRLRLAASVLGCFLAAVTTLVHAPALLGASAPVAHEADRWIWDTLQCSNFVKNRCLLGVCLVLPSYRPGRWSLDAFLQTDQRRLR